MTFSVAMAVLALAAGPAQAKRMPPPKVEPAIHEGVRYCAPNDDGRRAYVQARDAKTDKLLWEVTLFHNTIKRELEEDVQWVFIKALRVENGRLIVTSEGDRAHAVDLKTRAVTSLKQGPPGKTGSSQGR